MRIGAIFHRVYSRHQAHNGPHFPKPTLNVEPQHPQNRIFAGVGPEVWRPFW